MLCQKPNPKWEYQVYHQTMPLKTDCNKQYNTKATHWITFRLPKYRKVGTRGIVIMQVIQSSCKSQAGVGIHNNKNNTADICMLHEQICTDVTVNLFHQIISYFHFLSSFLTCQSIYLVQFSLFVQSFVKLLPPLFTYYPIYFHSILCKSFITISMRTEWSCPSWINHWPLVSRQQPDFVNGCLTTHW